MIYERWNGFRLECAARKLGGTENRRANLVPWNAKIQGVVFEPCGVLYDDSAWRRWLWQIAARVGLSCQYTPFFRAWEYEYQEAVWSGQLDLWTAIGQFLRSAGMSQPDIDEVIASSRAKFRRFEQETRPYPDVRWTLRQLSAGGYQLAAIAHEPRGDTKIRDRLDKAGIGKLVTSVLSQRPELQRPETPDADAAAEQQPSWQRKSLETLPGRSSGWVFVGRRQAGLDLARRMGLLTVAFNHDADATADVYIEQFSQLEQVLHDVDTSGAEYAPAKAA